MFRWLFLSLSVIPILLFGETKRFGSFMSSKGVPYSDVSDILEDTYGYMWIASDNGLLKFDGYDYLKYQNIKEDNNSLPNNFCYKLFQDSQNRLWICTTWGLVRYRYEYDNFERIKLNKVDRNGVVNIIEDKDGDFWLLNFDALIKYNYENNTEEIYPNITGMALADFGDEIWVCSMDSGICVFDKATHKTKMLPLFDEN